MAKSIRHLTLLIVDIRDNCRINKFLQDTMDFCEENCESKKLM